jgi:hypothetical protein
VEEEEEASPGLRLTYVCLMYVMQYTLMQSNVMVNLCVFNAK